MATRKIIILERINEPSDYDFRYVIRATYNPKFTNFKKDPNRKSILVDATLEENAEMIIGLVEERSGIAHFSPGTDIKEIQSNLEKRLSEFQSEIDQRNPFKLFQSSFDGTTWTLKGVA